MKFTVNVNEIVKVKLTDVGINILKQQHEELNERIKKVNGKGIGEFEIKLDNDGYYSTQLWVLMNTFGHSMTMSSEEPFHLDIVFEK